MIPRIPIGQLSQRVTIQTNTPIPTAAGGRTKVWANTATVWARVEPLSGNEQLHAMQINARITHKITMRHRALTADQRIVHKGIAFNIRSIINDDSRDRKLIVMAEQGVAA